MSSPSRKERARATRLRIIEAAHALFVERGYTGARMQDVADRAGVAVQTVYFTFHTKAELLQACYDRAVLGPDRLPPPMQPWHAEMLAARTGRAALHTFAAGNTTICQRVGILDDVTRSAQHEPEAVAVRAHSEAMRREGYAEIVRHLHTRFGLRDGLSVEAATDVLLTLGATGPYRSLVVDYGWSVDDYVTWLGDLLATTLLAPRTRSRRTP